jgi:putative component of membrane protein insertase Oxa1/YidC/SpoIIIJ protein YidD
MPTPSVKALLSEPIHCRHLDKCSNYSASNLQRMSTAAYLAVLKTVNRNTYSVRELSIKSDNI